MSDRDTAGKAHDESFAVGYYEGESAPYPVWVRIGVHLSRLSVDNAASLGERLLQASAEAKEVKNASLHLRTIRGQLAYIGFREEGIHFTLRDRNTGKTFDGAIHEVLAKKLAPYFWSGEIDISGLGEWRPDESGGLKLMNFSADSFCYLPDGSNYNLIKLLAVENYE